MHFSWPTLYKISSAYSSNSSRGNTFAVVVEVFDVIVGLTVYNYHSNTVTMPNVSWRFNDVNGGSLVFEIRQPSVAPYPLRYRDE